MKLSDPGLSNSYVLTCPHDKYHHDDDELPCPQLGGLAHFLHRHFVWRSQEETFRNLLQEIFQLIFPLIIPAWSYFPLWPEVWTISLLAFASLQKEVGVFLSLEASQCLEDKQLNWLFISILYNISAKMFFYKIRVFTESNDWHFKHTVLGGKQVNISVFMQCRSLVIRIARLLYEHTKSCACYYNVTSVSSE